MGDRPVVAGGDAGATDRTSERWPWHDRRCSRGRAPGGLPVSAAGSPTDPSATAPPVQAWRIPYVLNFALGRITSNIGSQIVTVAVGWQLYERTNDPWALGLVGLVTLAPGILLMLPAGNAADRFPRRNIAILAGLLTGLASLGLAAVSWMDGPVV